MLLIGYIKQSLGWLLFGMSLSLGLNVSPVEAQEYGTCAYGQAEAYLDVGNVRARLMNTGNLFWRGAPAVYEVPKDSGLHSIFTSALWVGGFVQDSLRMAAVRFNGHEFWPGPLDVFGQPPRDCSIYDRLAVLYRDDMERYEQSGYTSSSLQAWPWEWGAPVVDGDGDPTNYNLAAGDRPALLGDQTVWWVMNDKGNAHPSTETPPIGLEVQVSAFAFDAMGAVGNSTFYRYRLHYKGRAPLDSAYIALFVDPDLGNFDDDVMGSDTTLGMGYVYNVDDLDEDSYGEAPPALGVSLLQGPRALHDQSDNDRDGTVDEHGERLQTTAVTFYYGGGNVHADPQHGSDYYHYMQARWRDGSPLTYGGDGYSFSSQPTSFAFPGDPITRSFWSMLNMDNQGTAVEGWDQRFIVAAGPFRMEPDTVDEVVFAIVWSRGTSNLDSVRKLREDMAYIQSITPLLLEPQLPPPNVSVQERSALGYHRNYPNPFSDRTTIRYSLALPEHVTLTVYDMLGREVTTLVDEEQEAGWHEVGFDAEGLAPGAYAYRLQVGYARATEVMAVVR